MVIEQARECGLAGIVGEWHGWGWRGGGRIRYRDRMPRPWKHGRGPPVRLGDPSCTREHHEESIMSVGIGMRIARLGSEPRPFFALSDVRLPLTRFDLALCVLPIIAFLAIVSSV